MRQYKNHDPRRFQLNLSLTAAELEDIKQRAEALGLRPVHFARLAALRSNPENTVKSAPENQVLRKINLELARVGNNLNQISRNFHQLKVPLPNDLEPLLKDIRALIARLPQ
jgi:hypothetical protein